MFTPGSRPQAGNSWAQPKPDTGVLEDPSVIGGRRKLAMNRGRAIPEASSHLADVAVLPLTESEFDSAIYIILSKAIFALTSPLFPPSPPSCPPYFRKGADLIPRGQRGGQAGHGGPSAAQPSRGVVWLPHALLAPRRRRRRPDRRGAAAAVGRVIGAAGDGRAAGRPAAHGGHPEAAREVKRQQQQQH